MTNPKRYLKEAKESLKQCNDIVADTTNDTLSLSEAKAAAGQAQAAANTLYRLVGAIEAGLDTIKEIT
jgi:hypothetical protein